MQLNSQAQHSTDKTACAGALLAAVSAMKQLTRYDQAVWFRASIQGAAIAARSNKRGKPCSHH